MKKLFLIFWVLILHSVLSHAQNGLVVYYDFSGNATDQSGNGNDGTLQGGATANDTLSVGDNTQDYLTIPPGVLNGLNAFAITFKIKFNSFHSNGSWPTNHILTGDQTNLTEAFGFSYDMPYQQWWLAFNGNLYTFDDPNLQPGAWYCFLLERDSTGLISLYRDGIQNSSAYSYSSAINIQSLLIGQEDDCFAGCFIQNQCTNAKLDEFKIYDRSLTASEIAANCNQQFFTPQFSATDTDLCEKFCIDFFDQSNNNPTSWQWIFPGGSPPSSALQNPSNICYDVPGLYDVTLITTSANGNDTVTLPNYIKVNPTPSFPTITQVGYTLTSSGANAYQWQFNSVDIPGATSQSYTILQTGYYTVVVGDSNECKNSATLYVLISSVQDLNDDDGIFISPNPSHGAFTVEWLSPEMGAIGKEISINVINPLGQVIYSYDWPVLNPSEMMEIDLRRDASFCVSTGVYIIEIKTLGFFLRKKILIVNQQ